MKVYIESYGCTFNKADGQIIAGNLQENDIDIVGSMEEADVIIVNTCYVKLPTENKVTYRIQKLQNDFPDKKIIVGGCMVEIDPEKLDKVAPNASWIGPHQLNKSAEVVKSTYCGEVVRESGFSKESKVDVPKVMDDSLIHIIQICEGCLGACTFCCTRFARGPLNSYPIEDIKEEARKAIEQGACEIQLTAQDTAAFGKDSGEKLSDLIKEVANLDGDFRIRVGMMHPKNILNDVDEIIDAMKHPKVYNFIHLPIQSGSDKVLSDMRRGHSVNQYLDIVSKFKSEIPSLTLAVDIIVGYPTESEEDFNLTVELLEKIKPSLIHLSKYQHRKGAVSSSLPEIPHETMKRRSKFLSEIKSKITEEENKELVNSNQKVLVIEKGSKGGFIAKTNSYIPVIVDNVSLGTFVDVKITDATATYLKSELLG
ncbi:MULTISPECIES: tRNA (N(6)-L-threonylcarbamoyladenosine(37)-C(2))-methylthiotransferase [Methanobrevibacter]|uniref:tRNA-t(6)A37 methylthiotransferase n=1 Tax=Methanobrevibacter gottschalkii DSM 11977 TaxID=1122229 RepID=A0A3N5B7S7_9EURY|nr:MULTISPECIES: tRNA (N(6)-L-threonylcarbamoyladenosine(37)-C(2))-methylthiotransferase [Methanobrevibacter]OEC96821.1 threonylcarbamoyladenosine tRNA methylthiotransferase [Methanobrevibacter sp. A27]RPF51540.1 MiaB-like tRNA modifying enzyme [Methanobrevibacter gottschalkii DSM 11977]